MGQSNYFSTVNKHVGYIDNSYFESEGGALALVYSSDGGAKTSTIVLYTHLVWQSDVLTFKFYLLDFDICTPSPSLLSFPSLPPPRPLTTIYGIQPKVNIHLFKYRSVMISAGDLYNYSKLSKKYDWTIDTKANSNASQLHM